MADLTVTATSVLYTSGEKKTANAGETITAGQSLYVNATTGAVWKAQCDGTAAEADAKGIALNGGGAGQPIVYAAQGAVINIGATTAIGVTYYVSDTAGGVMPQADVDTAGMKYVRLGYATNTSGAFVIDIKNQGTEVAA